MAANNRWPSPEIDASLVEMIYRNRNRQLSSEPAGELHIDLQPMNEELTLDQRSLL
jgi:hypothetical protein